jgi:hypothetical protein
MAATTAKRLANKTAERESKRRRMKELFDEQKKIQSQMKNLQDELFQLDEEIDVLERQVVPSEIEIGNNVIQTHATEVKQNSSNGPMSTRPADPKTPPALHFSSGMTQHADESLTGPMTLTINPDEILTEPTQWEGDDKRVENGTSPLRPQHHNTYARLDVSNKASTLPSSYPSDQLNIAMRGSTLQSNAQGNGRPPTTHAHPPLQTTNSGTLDGFVRYSVTPPPAVDERNAEVVTNEMPHSSTHPDSFQPVSIVPQQRPDNDAVMVAQHPRRHDLNADYLQQLSSDNFPWSQEVNNLLQHTFRISSFRGHQKEIINCTLSGDDVFVIMRTGGGKSLTYQLPALLEGRGPQRKVSIVVSPLLSLIQDQEEQMNAFAGGSALSFCSNLAGGQAEHNRRWGLVRDPNAGVCLIFVTPEKVHNSGKFRNEMEKLHEQGRLGRFVIDECHCACQWGESHANY